MNDQAPIVCKVCGHPIDRAIMEAKLRVWRRRYGTAPTTPPKLCSLCTRDVLTGLSAEASR